MPNQLTINTHKLKLIVQLRDEEKMEFEPIGERLGLTASGWARAYRLHSNGVEHTEEEETPKNSLRECRECRAVRIAKPSTLWFRLLDCIDCGTPTLHIIATLPAIARQRVRERA